MLDWFGSTTASNAESVAKRIQISSPTDFKHQVHVGFDQKTGEYSGLPSDWNAKNLQSN